MPRALDLAADLDRWTAGEPIAARPIKPAERIWRWARREPVSAGLGMALVLTSFMIVINLIVSNVLIARERDEARVQRQSAMDEKKHAEAERSCAEERSRQARQAVDVMYTEVAEKWLYDQPKLSQVQREFLEKALALYEQFSREDGSDPEIQLERSKALSRLAWLQLRLGKPRDAEATLYKPIVILEKLVAEYPDRPRYREELGSASSTLASQLSEQKRFAEANALRENTVRIHQAMAAQFPSESRYQIELAINQAQLGLQYQLAGRAPEALKAASGSLATLDALRDHSPGRSDPRDLSSRMRSLEDVGFVLIENRRFPEAEAALREAIAIADRLPEGVVSHNDLLHRIGHTSVYLGHLLGRVGRWPEAEIAYRRADRLFRQLSGDFPDMPLYEVDVVDTQLGLIDVAREMGHHAEAMKLIQTYVDQSEKLTARHPDLVNCRRTLLSALRRQGQLAVGRVAASGA